MTFMLIVDHSQYIVTIVELASAAIQMLTSGKMKYDVILTNVNSPDLHGYKLVQHVVSMEIPVILMSPDDNTFMAMKALENSANLYLKKPVMTEAIGCLWQHVNREKTRMMRDRDSLIAANYEARAIELREPIHQDGGNPNNNGSNELLMTRDKGKSKKKNRESTDRFNENGGHFNIDNNKLKRKVCIKWIQELHAKFISAIEILGEGRCFQREILELMNVLELTQMQVASHLQKCRNENWRTPEERRAMNQALGVGSFETGGSHSKTRKFGSMPRIGKAVHQNKGVELSSQTRAGAESGMHGNRGNQFDMENNIVDHQVPGSFQLGPSHFSSNGRNQFDEFFNLPGMDFVIQDFSTMSQGFVINNKPKPGTLSL